MAEFFLAPNMVPYTLALALLFGLFLLELVFALLGGTLLGAGGGEADLDAADFAAEPFEMDLDLEPGFDLENGLDFDFAGMEAELADYDLPAFEGDPVAEAAPEPSGLLAWLGMGKAPFVLWLASLLLGFGLTGTVLVNVVSGSLGFALPLVLSLPVAVFAGVWFAGRFATVFAAILPKTETQVLSRSRLARRRGVITQGTARRGHPAEVRVTDYWGNLHYIRAEPLADDDVLDRGTEVLVLRHRETGGYRLIAFSG
jgi:hypothetical protein